MRDKIQALAAQHRRFEAKRAALIARARAFHAELNEAIGDAKIYGASAIVTLDYIEDISHTYGYLSYNVSDLQVCSRSSDDDMQDAYRDEDDQSGYRRLRLEDVPVGWLQALLTEETLSSLLQNIAENLEKREERLDATLSDLQAILESESAEIEAQMITSLAALNSEAVARNWQATLDATHLDTADALTRATTMLESVCTAILNWRSIALPKDKSLSPLLKACVKSLNLPDLPELEDDLKQLLGGVTSICGGAASLRTHFGTAHGASSHLEPLDAAFAVLAKNTCAAAAIFLIDRHKNGESQASPQEEQ